MYSLMCDATPSSTGPICTTTSLFAISSAMTRVQLGGAKAASCSGRPTLRRSTSKAATTSTSLGPVAAELEVEQAPRLLGAGR